MPVRIGEIVEKVNRTLPLHSMWDGFWIHSFRRKTLILSCSFDRIYYRNYDLIFKQVVFFNLPDQWRDTDVYGDNLLRLASQEEFKQYHPGFDPENHFIFAFDLHINTQNKDNNYIFFVLAKHIYLIQCEPPDNRPVTVYTDSLEYEAFPCMKNRAIKNN